MTSISPEVAIVSGAASVAVALVAGIMAYLSSRRQVKVDVQKTLNDGFGSLINELQEERATLMEERVALRARNEELLDRLRELETRLATVTHEAARLNNALAAHGLSPPGDD